VFFFGAPRTLKQRVFCDETIKGNFDERKYAKINKRL